MMKLPEKISKMKSKYYPENYNIINFLLSDMQRFIIFFKLIFFKDYEI